MRNRLIDRLQHIIQPLIDLIVPESKDAKPAQPEIPVAPLVACIAMLAAVDLQFVYIDGEHGRFDWHDIEAACIAAERHRLTPIARIPDILP